MIFQCFIFSLLFFSSPALFCTSFHFLSLNFASFTFPSLPYFTISCLLSRPFPFSFLSLLFSARPFPPLSFSSLTFLSLPSLPLAFSPSFCLPPLHTALRVSSLFTLMNETGSPQGQAGDGGMEGGSGRRRDSRR